MHRFEFQRRGLGVEEICSSPSHRTFGLDIGVCHETRMRNLGKFQLFHMTWVFRDSALGLRFWSGCVCLPCILGSVLRYNAFGGLEGRPQEQDVLLSKFPALPFFWTLNAGVMSHTRQDLGLYRKQRSLNIVP